MEKFPCNLCNRKLNENPKIESCSQCSKWYPCKVCNKNVNNNHKSIQCDNKLCNQWVHMKCNLLNNNDYKILQNSDDAFYCIKCIEKNIPFSKLSNNEFNISVTKAINTNDDEETHLQFFSDDQQNYLKKINNMLNRTSGEITPDDESPSINCNYYSVDEFSKANFDSSKCFSIFHLNIHSIQLHFEELKLLLQLIDFKFDIIAISESKLEKGVEPIVDITLENYHNPIGTPTEATKGGVLLYISKNLNFKPRNDLNIYASKQVESKFVEIINPSKSNSLIGIIYRHPSMSGDEFNEEYLRPLTHKLNLEKNKNIHIAGDFNFDLLNVSSHNPTSDFFDLLTSNFLLPMISLPTKINPTNNTLIDNVFTNQFDPDLISGNLTIGISDHLPSFLIIPKPNQRHLPKKHNIYKRNFKSFDRENFLLDLLNINWDNIIQVNNQNPNSSFNSFLTTLNQLLDRYAPLQKITNKEHKLKYKPWISDDVLKNIKVKNKLYNSYTKCKLPDKKAETHSTYKILRNQINEQIKINKKKFYQDYFSNNNKNLRKIWLGIKELINIKTKTHDLPTCLIENNETITDPIDISNQFNNYFSGIAESILDERRYHGNKTFTEFLKDPLHKATNEDFHPTNEKEVIDLISQLNVNKSTGPNGIPTHILHLIKLEIAKPLSQIINLSFTTGIHPDQLKLAQVIPIFKKGSRLSTGNYRPISLLSNINKIFEKIMHSRLYCYLDKTQFFYPLQFGFREQHSTNHALISIADKINEALDKNKVACGVFIDFQKAFDTVNHEILIAKLSHHGIRGNINKWFQSYLHERKQFVSILGFNSSQSTLYHGVPQGSVLGPLLFLIYINDLHNSIKFSTVYHFADDTNLLRIDDSYKRIQYTLNQDLKSLFQWLLANKISLNVTKTELIYFKKPLTPSPPPELKIKINGSRITPTKSIKYLGIHLDDNLSGISHCTQLLPKLRRSNGILAKARHQIPISELLSIYYSTFASHLNYGSQVWAQKSNTLIKKIEVLQKNAVRIMTFSEFKAHTSPLFKALKILKFKDQLFLFNCLLVHDQLNSNLPENFDDFFITNNDLNTINTKSSKTCKLFTPFVNSVRYGRNSIKHSCIISWNHCIEQFPNTDFMIIKRSDLKKLITDKFLDSY